MQSGHHRLLEEKGQARGRANRATKVEVKPDKAAIIYSTSTPEDNPMGGPNSAEAVLNVGVPGSVCHGGR